VALPRGSNGTYTLPIGSFIPGGLIKSSDLNSDFSDIATALTQSLATTGVSTMTGPINAAAGLVTTPSITFNGAPKTGFYLAGPNQIGFTTNGIQAGTINADSSVNFAGNVTIGGILSASAVPIGAVIDFAGSAAPAKWLLCYGQLISTTTYAALFAVLGTTYGSGSGTFGIPDCRGRATFGQDNMGGSAANRITVAGGNFDGTVLGNSGGLQNQTLTLAQLPTGITAVGSWNVVGASNNSLSFMTSNSQSSSFSTGTGGGSTWFAMGTGATVLTQGATASGTVTSNNTSGASHPILSPAMITNKIIYAGI
jgi:microcystin-dependent protein